MQSRRPISPMLADSSHTTNHVLLLGTLTTPHGSQLRTRIRRMPTAIGVSVRFVLGHDCFSRLELEAHTHGDLVGLNVSECSLPADERKQMLSAKVFAWFRYAATQPFRWYGKTDDDTLVSLPKLRHDLLAAEDASGCRRGHGRCRIHAFYGAMRWRLFSMERWKPCGSFTEVGPPDPPPDELQPTASCIGPFPYADGSLYVVSAPLAQRAWVGETAQRLAAARPGWSEDIRSGFVVFAESVAQRLPTIWLSVRRWVDMRFWLDATDASQAAMMDGRVVWVHRMKDGADANLTASRMRSSKHVGGRFRCAMSCGEWWRSRPLALHFPPPQSRCCHKVEDSGRQEGEM